jgi:hypothetical protein
MSFGSIDKRILSVITNSRLAYDMQGGSACVFTQNMKPEDYFGVVLRKGA